MAGQIYRVLIVENDPTIASQADEELGRSKMFDVSVVSTLQEAVSYLSEWRVDGIALDLNLPDATDMEALQVMHGRYPAVPIMVITRFMEREEKALQEGAEEVLVRPFGIQEMLGKMVAVIERKRARNHVNSTQKAVEEFRDAATKMTDSALSHERGIK